VAHNLVIDTFRRKRPEELELAEWLESDAPDPAHSAELQQQMDYLRQALAELTDAQHQVIMLKFFQGLDSREAAQVTGKSEGAVDALQHRALEALRKALREGPGSDASGKPATIENSEDNVEKGDTTGRTYMHQPWLAGLLAWLLPERLGYAGAALSSHGLATRSPNILLSQRKAIRWRLV
jgi:hypothetical protein